MLGNLLGGLFDKNKIVHDTIQTTLENVSEELNCKFNELFIMIKPIDKTFTMKFYIYKIENSPKLVREITLSEILGDEE